MKEGSAMRAKAIIASYLVVLFAVAWPGPAAAQPASDSQNLAAFAQRIGLRDANGFVDAIDSVRQTGHLPEQYVTKAAAQAHGWHGGGLCRAWRGHMIGGDVFENFAGALPAVPGRISREADLDETCRSRGAKRLIFASDGGLIYVTVDHYRSFTPAP
jgi:ribonuclease